MTSLHKKISELETKIIFHKGLYYSGRPEISDTDFDLLEAELKLIDPNNQSLNIVGSISTSLEKVQHESKMLSLSKTYKTDDLLSWANISPVVSMYKVDGVSCSVIYKNGRIQLAKTRGDGSFGENITSKALWINSIPKEVIDIDCEIRGEIFCTEESFFNLSEEMVSRGLDQPTSMRNIVAGLICRKDNLELCRFIEFKAFDIILNKNSDENLKTEMDKYHFLVKCGFNVLDVTLHQSEETIRQSIDKSKEFMDNGCYQIDGLVFAYNDLSLHEELGETSHHPRYKMAFKFAGEVKSTIIKEIVWSVSRNGILTPVAQIEDTILSGATISRVTLHNYGMVKLNTLKIGDKIEIIRSGEVIPKFVRILEASNNEFIVPEICPSCSSKVEINDIRLICNNKKCSSIIKENILNFIQKIGIEDLSSKRLDEMLKHKVIDSIPDLYTLKVEDLLVLDKVKAKLATKLIASIEKSKSANLIIFLSSLGLTGGAFNKCEKVVQSGYDTIEKIKSLTVEMLMNIDSFAEKSSTDFHESLTNKYELIDLLITYGFSFSTSNIKESIISNKKICITGSLSTSRTIVESKIRDLGGIVTGSISKKTDFLLTNDTDGKSSKYKKALDLGIDIINEEYLNKIQ